MDTAEIEKLNNQSKGFQIVSAIVGVVFGWAGLNITFTLAKEYDDVTFGSLLLAAPLFTVFLLGFLCLWFARMTSGTNAALLAILNELRTDNPDLQTAESSRPSSATTNPETSSSQEAGRTVMGTWTCYAHNTAWCRQCRNL